MTGQVRIAAGTGDLLGCVTVEPVGSEGLLHRATDQDRATAADVLILPVHGGMLIWDALHPASLPAAILENPSVAMDWAWWLWGTQVAVAILATDPIEAADPLEMEAAPAAPNRADAALRLAHAVWLAAWWPASDLDDIPALDLVALATEAASLRALVDGLLGDGPLGALPDVPVEEGSLTATRPALVGPATQAPVADQSRFALAAGGAEPPIETAPGRRRIASGTCGIDWGAVPAGLVDASERCVRWQVLTDAGRRSVVIRVATGHLTASDTQLRAVFGPVFVPLQRSIDTYGRDTWMGKAELPDDLSAPWPIPCVHLPGFAPPRPPADGATLREAVRALARARLDLARSPEGAVTPARPGGDRIPLWEAERRAAADDDAW